MAWGDPSDYWWLKPTEPDNPLPAMQLGAQLRQQAIANSLKQKDLELETQRTGIQIQEYFSKKELQNSIMAGNAELAKTISENLSNGFTPDTDEFQIGIHEVARKYPMVMQEPAWKGITTMGRDAVKAAETADYHRGILAERAASTAARRDTALARMGFLYDQLAKTDATKAEANRIASLRAETQALLADSRISVDDERVKKLVADTEAIGARTSIAQGNLDERQKENTLRESGQKAAEERRRAEAKLPEADRIKLNHELNVLREQLDTYELTPAEYYKKRDEAYQKYTPKSEATPGASPPPLLRFDPATGRLDLIK